MPDREKVMSWLEGLAEPDWRECYSDSEVQETARQALDLIDELLKEQKAEKPVMPWNVLGKLDDGTYKGKCGNCGFVHYFIEGHDAQYKFCPQCGEQKII